MTVRRESVQTRSETGTQRPGDWLCRLRQCQSPQYVERLNGETARRSRVSALAAEALMKNAGEVAFSLACICLQGAVMVFTEESGTVSPMPSHLSMAWDPLRVSRPSLTVFSHFLYPPSSLGYNQSLIVAGLVVCGLSGSSGLFSSFCLVHRVSDDQSAPH
jgi:hypothetical protein